MEKVKIKVNGKEVEGILVSKLYMSKRKRKVKDKVYEWEEEYLHIYIPKDMRSGKYIIIPLKE